MQLGKRSLLDPATPNAATAACNDANQNTDPQCYNIDYRCLAMDLGCDQPMNTKGAKTNCTERRDSFLTSIDQYVQFFAGLPNPSLYLAGIWSPTLLDNLASSPAKDGKLFVDYVSGPMNSAGLNRGRTTQAACYNSDPSLTSDPNGFFGQAQLRLSSFIRRFQAQTTLENSICDAQNYPGALDTIASGIITPPADCLAAAPKVASGTPECVVGYVDATNAKGTPDVAMPVCSAKCCDFFATDSAPKLAGDPTLQPNPHLAAELAACSADPDCYCAVPSAVNCGSGAVAGLWRAGNAVPPAGKQVNFQCAYSVAAP